MLTNEINLKTFAPIALTSEIDKLCTPLKEALNLKFFNYIHTDKNNFRFTLSNHKCWFQHYFEMQHYNYEIMNHFNKKPSSYNNISLWDGCNSNHKSCQIYKTIQKDLEVGYILFIFAFYKNHAESFGFGFDNKVQHATQIIFNNLDVFVRFSQYFKDAGQEAIEVARQFRYQVIIEKQQEYSNPFVWGIDSDTRKNLFKELQIDKIFLKNAHANVFLTLAEGQTVLLAIRGLTYREIAAQLKVSPKTIDYRMEQIRKKLKLTHKKDLIKLFVEEQYLELIELSV